MRARTSRQCRVLPRLVIVVEVGLAVGQRVSMKSDACMLNEAEAFVDGQVAGEDGNGGERVVVIHGQAATGTPQPVNSAAPLGGGAIATVSMRMAVALDMVLVRVEVVPAAAWYSQQTTSR